MGAQVTSQFIGVMATVIYTGVVSAVILKVIDLIIGLRINEEEEAQGLDLAAHDERGYIL